MIIVHHFIQIIARIFLLIGEGPIGDINGSIGVSEKKFSTNFSKGKAKFWLSLHYNDDDSYLFVNRTKIYKLKADNKNFNFSTQFCLGSISKKIDVVESTKVYLKGNLYNYSVDGNAINNFDILIMHMHLMVKNNIK